MSETKSDGRCGGSLRGAAASLYLAMILHPGPHTPTSLEILTHYTYKPIRLALTTLNNEGLVRHDDVTGVWTVVPGTPLLRRLQRAMDEASTHCAPGGWTDRAFSPEATEGEADYEDTTSVRALNRVTDGLSTELSPNIGEAAGKTPEPTGKTPALSGEIPVVHDNRLRAAAGTGSAGGKTPDRYGEWAEMGGVSPAAYGNIPEHRPEDERGAPGVNPAASGESPGMDGESPAAAGESPVSRACITTTTAKSPDTLEQEVVSKQAGKKRGRASPRRSPEARVMAAWLERGGVGRYSPKMDELLARDLDLEVVQAHVLERLACEKGLVSGQPIYTPGLLVRKLEDGDPPPPMRCEKCFSLRRLSSLGWCDCELEQVISR